MKKILSKCSDILGWIVGYGFMISLFVGGLTFFGYLIAIIIGGETAVKICEFIYKDLFPILVIVTSILVVLGLIKMYLSGESALKPSSKKKQLAKVAKNSEKFDKEHVEQENCYENKIEQDKEL